VPPRAISPEIHSSRFQIMEPARFTPPTLAAKSGHLPVALGIEPNCQPLFTFHSGARLPIMNQNETNPL